MYKRILVPVDGSQFGEQALPLALSLARRCGADLHLATVELLPTMFPEAVPAVPPTEVARRYLEDLVARIRKSAADVPVHSTVLSGEVVEALEHHRERIGAGAIVMSTHGRGPVTRAWLGSVADQLVRQTRTPLVLVRPTSDSGEVDFGASVSIGTILVTVDGSALSEAVLDDALAMAGLFGAQVHLLRVVEYPHQLPSAYLPETVAANQAILAANQEAANREITALTASLKERGVVVTGVVKVENFAAGGILEYARESGAGLIAMATHGRGGIRRMMLGSVADKVVRAASLPILLVHPEGRA